MPRPVWPIRRTRRRSSTSWTASCGSPFPRSRRKRVYSTLVRTASSIAAVTGDRIDLVLFDLGGVLIRPGGVASMKLLSGIDSDEALWTRWLSCQWVRRFEAGQCGPDEFAAGMVADWYAAREPAAVLDEL